MASLLLLPPPPGSSATGLRGTSSSTTAGRSSPCGVSRPPGTCLSSAMLTGRGHSPMQKRGLTCWDQGPSLGLPGLWVARRRVSLLKGWKKRAQEEPHTRLEAEIQVAGGVPRAIALYVQKSFPPRHGESTRRDPEQQLRGRRQRGPGSWAEACEEEHHSGGRRQAPPGCGGNWREKAGPEQRLLDESL